MYVVYESQKVWTLLLCTTQIIDKSLPLLSCLVFMSPLHNTHVNLIFFGRFSSILCVIIQSKTSLLVIILILSFSYLKIYKNTFFFPFPFLFLNKGNRTNLMDARDPGGRIGPYLPRGRADLRNLMLITSPCQKGDIFFAVSDGNNIICFSSILRSPFLDSFLGVARSKFRHMYLWAKNENGPTTHL